MTMQYDLGLSQRWRYGRPSFVPPDSRINPSEYAVEEIRRTEAAAFLAAHHYLASVPVAMACAGLFRKRGVAPAELVGAAVFGQPGSPDAIAARTGLPREAGIELTRLAIVDDVAFNGETFFIKRARRMLLASRPGIRAILANSDPCERSDEHGNVTFPGHVGTIYAASSAIYVGRAKGRAAYLCRDGSVVPDRNLSKIRASRPGSAAAARRLVDAGAPDRRHG